MKYLGDIAEDQVIYFRFSTHKADGTPITLAGTPVISVYKDDNDTQSTAGIALSVDDDSVTGMHTVKIDTSADAFYAVGSDYSVVLTAGTVDSVSVVGTVLAVFSIENRTAFPKADYPTNFSNLSISATTGLVSLAPDQAVNVTKWGGTAVASANVLIDGAITAAKIAASALDGKGNWNTTAPPTTAQIKAAIEAEGSHLALILADTGTDIPATLSTISGYVDCLPESWVIPSTFDPATDEVDVGKVSGEDVELGTIGVVGLKRVSA